MIIKHIFNKLWDIGASAQLYYSSQYDLIDFCKNLYVNIEINTTVINIDINDMTTCVIHLIYLQGESLLEEKRAEY